VFGLVVVSLYAVFAPADAFRIVVDVSDNGTAAEQLRVLDLNDLCRWLLVCFLFHSFFCLLVKGVAALKILKKFISKIIRTAGMA
jgi:hypothetical protein